VQEGTLLVREQAEHARVHRKPALVSRDKTRELGVPAGCHACRGRAPRFLARGHRSRASHALRGIAILARMKNTALLIIDVQQSFEHRPYYTDSELPAFRDALSGLASGCVARGVPIVRVMHVEPEGAFSLASGLVVPMTWAPAAHDLEIHKHVHNAFTDTGLDRWLRARKIDRVIVSGIRTEQCCETTARVASDLGYSVDFVSEATLTFPMTHPRTGRAFTAAEIKERTELVLEGRFARVTTVAAALG
jgi:nicotinamidase-related amidase